MWSELYSLCVDHSVQLVAWGKWGRYFFFSLVRTTEKINCRVLGIGQKTVR